MLAVIHSCGLRGLEGFPVRVEVDVSSGLPGLHLVGLPDAVLREARERVRAAIRHAGLEYPNRRITVSLAPSELPKTGSGYDLPIAMGVLAASGQIPPPPQTSLFLGELALDGGLCHVTGVLCVADVARRLGTERLYLPAVDAAEAALISGLQVLAVEHLRQLVEALRSQRVLEPEPHRRPEPALPPSSGPDLGDVGGQEQAKRALEVAAGGSHGLLLCGPPGVGKTLLARTMPSLLPPLGWEEALEVSKIYSIAGLLPRQAPLIWQRPFRSPHHSASLPALLGGGPGLRPGEISLAHRGILFLDELPEFRRPSLEALRQPLEDRRVVLSRAQGSVEYPASFTLAATMNPCPCGFRGDPERECRCTQGQLQAYRHRLSGPLLDRIDLHLELERVPVAHLLGRNRAEPSSEVRERVLAARERQRLRFTGTWLRTNGEMGPAQVRRYCPLDGRCEAFLTSAARKLRLSARALHRVIKVARTIADLEGVEDVGQRHLAEALSYRSRLFLEV